MPPDWRRSMPASLFLGRPMELTKPQFETWNQALYKLPWSAGFGSPNPSFLNIHAAASLSDSRSPADSNGRRSSPNLFLWDGPMGAADAPNGDWNCLVTYPLSTGLGLDTSRVLFFAAMTMPPAYRLDFSVMPGSDECVDREDDPYRPSRNDRRAITTPLAMGPNALPVQRWDY